MKVVIVLLIFVFFSCSNNSSSVEVESSTQTLRDISIEYENEVSWVDGIDTSINEEKAQTTLITQDTTPIDYTFQHFESDKKVYPTLKNFEILDTDSIPKNLYSELTSFLSNLQSKNLQFDSFSTNHQYLKTLTEYNTQDLPQCTEYYIGKPTKILKTYEVPIRFIFENSYSNNKIYYQLENNSYKIVQIDLGELQNE